MIAQNRTGKAFKTRRWVVGAALLLLTTQFQGLVPLLFAGLAWIDGGHHVHLSTSEVGYRLVLSHDTDAALDSTHSRKHHHCLIDSVLIAFANPDPTEEADHNFSFHNPGQLEDSARLKALPLTRTELVLAPQLLVVSEVLHGFVQFVARPHADLFSRPPPSSADTSFVRHTVLLV